MKRIHSSHLGALIVLTSLVGCASTNAPQGNPLNAIGQGLSTIESTAQSGQQAIAAGTAAAANATTAATTVTTAATTAANQISLVDILMNQLGVSQAQALGGAGAIFQVAQGNMNPQAFATMSQSIPGMSTLLNAAPTTPSLGGASSILGGNSTLGSMAALATSFQQLNLSPDMVSQFIPIVTNYVSQMSGQTSAGLLQSALTAR